MGYYTNYKMKICDIYGDIVFDMDDQNEIDDYLEYEEEYKDTDLTKVLKEIMENKDDFYGLLSEEPCKWYDHEKNLQELSKKHKLVFMLSGYGEEQGDMWRKYFYDGKVKEIVPELRWPKFDAIREFCIGDK